MEETGREVDDMLIFSVLVFAIVTFFVAFLIGHEGASDKGKTATVVTLVAWGSLIAGLYMGRIPQ